MNRIYPGYDALHPAQQGKVDRQFGELWIAAEEVPDLPPRVPPQIMGTGSSVQDAVFLAGDAVKSAAYALRGSFESGIRYAADRVTNAIEVFPGTGNENPPNDPNSNP